MSSLPKISNVDENNNTLVFTLSDINISYANAIRRVLLSDIPCLVFKTSPYDENNVSIIINKSRLNNELIKQRISSIPIHKNNIDEFEYQNYMVELDKMNDTNTIIYATTEDFKVKNIELKKYLDSSEVKQLFPPDQITGDYIDIVRLRPKLTDNSECEHIKLEASLTISNAKEDGTFNVVSTCSYGNTLDPIKIKDEWALKEETLKNKVSKDELEFIKKDWMLLDAKRLFIADSYDFIIETLGIYTNYELVNMATSIIIKKLYMTLESLKNNNDLIEDSIDTLDNSYIIKLINEDYTIGKIIEYCLYNKYFNEEKLLNYVGFIKKHPHDTFSIIKISLKKLTSKDEILIMIEECVNSSILILNSIKEYFSEK